MNCLPKAEGNSKEFFIRYHVPENFVSKAFSFFLCMLTVSSFPILAVFPGYLL
jgi:hypothetical protein